MKILAIFILMIVSKNTMDASIIVSILGKNLKINKNLSGDEIANINFLRRYRTRTSKYEKRYFV